MAYFDVYAPFSGTGKGRDCYPNCCSHNSPSNCCISWSGVTCDGCACRKHIAGAGLCRAADVFGSPSAQVRMYLSSSVLSAWTTHTGFCANAPPPGFEWVNWGVKVQLYCSYTRNSNTFIGTILYGHLRTRNVGDGQAYNDPSGLLIGTLGGVGEFCRCDCYPDTSQHHVHMARSLHNNAITNTWNCGTTLYGATSLIFRFDKAPGNCI